MTSPSELEPLLVRHKVSREDSNKKISDKDIEKISRTCGFPCERLSSYLGMKQVCAEDTKKNGKSELDRRASLLQGWKQMKGTDATYRALIAAFLELERRDDAEAICTLLRELKLATPVNPVHTPKAPSGKYRLDTEALLLFPS